MAGIAIHRKRRKLKSEINVVPYIDVMLVLLIIFMVTAPLLNVGVDVNLPQANAKALDSKKDPVVVQVDKDGNLALMHEGFDRPRAVSREQLLNMVRGFKSADADLVVYVAGDRDARYSEVLDVMADLQGVGIARVGLMGEKTAGSAGK
ncbi:protein TolR [Thermomonas carbonis]|uniref:Tol-Pal system protein TolR n=1 Tax=Thermomonas carbonis TaxID=1463158 RepID=A0A7G9SLN0_9GAMM|nr:protein TolR [Thermomonas carbonis]QNN68755.1 protein TolR [Thermomonas carbonis]GHC09012.1 protein TolR [Thermomonas carbonis]